MYKRQESEGIKFLEKVNEGFKLIAKEKNWKVISATQNISTISNQIKETLLKIMFAALRASKPEGNFKYIPSKPEGKTIILGAGKASASMARAFEQIYPHKIEGLVVTRYGHSEKTKYIKDHKGRIHWNAKVGFSLNFGAFGLKALQPERLTARQIEAARRAMTRYIKRGGNIWIRIFPDKPITKKPLEVRMGKGKGNVEYWVALVQPGKIMFEMAGVEEELAREAFRLASAKLPIKTHFIKKDL